MSSAFCGLEAIARDGIVNVMPLTTNEEVRERILQAAAELFAQQGIRHVGVDAVAQRADVPTMTFFTHFRTKNDLVMGHLRRWDQGWRAWFEQTTIAAGRSRRLAVMGVFDALGAWFHSPDFRGSPLINALVEFPDPKHPARVLAAAHQQALALFIRELASQSQLAQPEMIADHLLLLIQGAISMALVEEPEAVLRRARSAAEMLIGQGQSATLRLGTGNSVGRR